MACHSSGPYQLSTQNVSRCGELVIARTRTPWMMTSYSVRGSLPARRTMCSTAADTNSSRRPSRRSMFLSFTAVRVLVRVVVLLAPIGLPGHSGTCSSGAGGNVNNSTHDLLAGRFTPGRPPMVRHGRNVADTKYAALSLGFDVWGPLPCPGGCYHSVTRL